MFWMKQEVGGERLPSSRAAGSQSPPSGGTSWSVAHAFPARRTGRSYAGRSSRPWCRASGSSVWRPPASDTALCVKRIVGTISVMRAFLNDILSKWTLRTKWTEFPGADSDGREYGAHFFFGHSLFTHNYVYLHTRLLHKQQFTLKTVRCHKKCSQDVLVTLPNT